MRGPQVSCQIRSNADIRLEMAWSRVKPMLASSGLRATGNCCIGEVEQQHVLLARGRDELQQVFCQVPVRVDAKEARLQLSRLPRSASRLSPAAGSAPICRCAIDRQETYC